MYIPQRNQKSIVRESKRDLKHFVLEVIQLTDTYVYNETNNSIVLIMLDIKWTVLFQALGLRII